MKWVDSPYKYSNSQQLVHKGTLLGSVVWDSCAPKGSEKNWRAYINLPNCNAWISHHQNKDDAQKEVEICVKKWFARFEGVFVNGQ